jgi:5-(carboxyamino)imidazole ribonucleotide synthase
MKYFPQDLNLKIGILGAGQLGWMLILEGKKYPFSFFVLGDKEDPASKIADKFYTPEDYLEMIDSCDIVTYEFEHVYEKALIYADEKRKLLPNYSAVELKIERHKEKEFYKKHGLPTPNFFIAENGNDALNILKKEFNNIGVIKKSRGGYDGKGQYFIKNDLKEFEFIKEINETFVVEEFIQFDYEASIVATSDGHRIKCYEPTYNYNEKGILVYNYGPLENQKVKFKMREIAEKLARILNYVGTFAIEFFVKDDNVLINEFAPRVHNTGHFTLDAAYVSQFEQHIRAITNLELAEAKILKPSGMVNILGINKIPEEVLKYGKMYWYGKEEVRKRRKMGHVNVVGDSIDEVKMKIEKIMKIIYKDELYELL